MQTRSDKKSPHPVTMVWNGFVLAFFTVVSLYAASFVTANFLFVFFGPPLLAAAAVLAAPILYLTGRPESRRVAGALVVAALVTLICAVLIISSFEFTS